MSELVFDFQKLMKTFTEMCPDFDAEPDYNTATVSRRFAEHVIFDCSKQAQLAKIQGMDKTWRIQLETQGKQEKIGAEVIIIMYVTKTVPLYQPILSHGSLRLTFKQASLLAVAKYCQLVHHQVCRSQIVLTPLAGAVFTKDDIPKLAKALGEPLENVVMAVISSCQSDGYYLEHSRCYIALRALQKTVINREMRISLLKKSLKLYQLHGKDFDIEKYKICCKFVRPNSSNSRRGTAPSDDLDYLVSEITALDIPIVAETPSKPVSIVIIKQKPNLRCAARFTNQPNRNTKI